MELQENEFITIKQKKGENKAEWKLLEPVFFINYQGKIKEDYVGKIVRVECLTTNNTGKENLVITNESMDKYLAGYEFIYYTGLTEQKIIEGRFFKSKEELIKSL